MTARAADPYRPTIYACYVGYICQAIINNFAPLLFLTFGSQFENSRGAKLLIIAWQI